MNLYIYDDFLSKSRYNNIINKTEIRITDLGLTGKIIRLGLIRSIKSLVQQEIRSGVKNIIAVGNNNTIHKIISSLVDDSLSEIFLNQILFSIIPIGPNQSIANSFGIKNEEEACNIILARRVEEIDIGLIGKNYFLNKLEFLYNNININFKDNFSIETNKKTKTIIYNIIDNKSLKNIEKFNPCDNVLDLFIFGKKNEISYFPIKEIKIDSNGEILLDNSIKCQTPNKISILDRKLKVIVGKNRFF